MPRIIRKGERTPLTGPDDSRHGTNTTYVYWLCRCDRCRAAHAEYNTDLKRRLAARPTPEHVHGTVNGYSNHGCRCEPCTTAQRVARQARDARRAAASVELLTPASHTPKHLDQTRIISRCDLGFEHIVER